MLHTEGSQDLIEYNEYTLRWPTDDGLQRLTQGRRETSSSSTEDGLDECI